MQNLVNNLKSAALQIGETFTPVLRESKFRETGVLTPEEYVAAGDHLVHHCPTWKWAGASDPSKIRTFLPIDKQFLITRNVPCHKRCKQMEYDEKLEKIINEEDGEYQTSDETGWVDTHHYEKEHEKNEEKEQSTAPPPAAPEDSDDDDEEPLDLDELGLDDDEEDPNRFVVEKKPLAAGNDNSGEVEKVRTYDLHICYDKYYQVPRLFLMGYDENRRPLTVEQTYEDFSADHSNKTITVEAHPSVDLTMPTVHPCKHAEMMKRLINQYAESGKVLGVHEYLFLFLKFVQAVIPTIEYDYTRAIKL
ncbi:Ubiquitin-like-conjugating enzyme ATG3 [Caenorhabditis elegans]|uniref:Ubiquitin-like-conjugating enzyme ATG3 n=2 Tax=Caenorhabditis elegans TaxID=6239 RepID=Q9N369_CAEEL|nr:Ubiquitin-like-conjugating enzyme ATG3 [Caenorhabditis elegans]CCD74062.1 Ubiquitin-like-conjugating enzyme ATG3 [Caenorhabditis elegans]|eukprot:NP_500024.1 Autophagy-related protein 3 [Caenorhabditis elegans]